MRFRPFWLLFLAVAATLPALAEEKAYVKRGQIERQGRAWVEVAECGAPVAAGGRLVVRADMGSVVVTPGSGDGMDCRVRLRAYAGSEEEARRMLSRYELSVHLLEPGGARLQGRVRHSPARLRLNARFEIRVPLRFNLDLQTSGGDLRVERLEGELQAVTAGGDITTGDIAGRVRAETAGGSITLGTIGARVEARTAGGNIQVSQVEGDATLETSGGEIVTGLIAGAARVTTAGGDIVLRGAGADVVAETAGGQIRIGETRGAVEAQTAGGSIQLDAAGGPVRVHTAGGSIYLDGVDSAVEAATVAGTIRVAITASPGSFQSSALRNSFGDVEVYLLPGLALTIEAVIDNAFDHKILSDFPVQIQGGGSGYHPRTVEGRAVLNGGGEVLRIHTTGGNIEIRKLDVRRLQQLQQRQNLEWQRLQRKLQLEERRREVERKLKEQRRRLQEKREERREQERQERQF